MNDPNGLVYVAGFYHMFFQNNPKFNFFGPMYWGHAVSEDLVTWQHLHTALSPDREEGQAYSGSAVVDRYDSSGLCSGANETDPGCPVVLFTRHGGLSGGEKQSLAYSLDQGFSLTLYPHNPVLPNPGVQDFRDPKVFRHEATNRWIMALTAGDRVMLYWSDDLISWDFLSDFVPPAGSVTGVIECPELVDLPVDGNEDRRAWALFVSLNQGPLSPGGGVKYFVGDFDGTRFTTGQGEALWADYGADFYAAQSWSNAPDGSHIWIAWMNNWQYAFFTPTHPWRGAMTLPREIGLTEKAGGLVLVQQPVPQLSELRYCRLYETRDGVVDGAVDLLEGAQPGSLEIRVRWDIRGASEFGLKLRMNADGSQYTTVGYDVGRQTLFIDRSKSGTWLIPTLSPRQEAPLSPENGEVSLQVFLDWSSVEIFAGDGTVVMTDMIFPSPDSDRLALYSEGGMAAVVSLEIDALRTIWPE